MRGCLRAGGLHAQEPLRREHAGGPQKLAGGGQGKGVKETFSLNAFGTV